MLNEAASGRDVITIQTPIETIPADAKDAWKNYLAETHSTIISTDTKYRRLVVVERDRDEPITRIKEFLTLLVKAAHKVEEKASVLRPFDLMNAAVGFVLADEVRDIFYSNMDIHCPSSQYFSIAFMSKEAARSVKFGSSLHLRDTKKIVCPQVKHDLDEIWSEAEGNRHVLRIGNFYQKFDGEPKTLEKRDEIIRNLSAEVDRIITQLRSKTCACPVRGARPSEFVNQLTRKNPAWLSELQQALCQQEP